MHAALAAMNARTKPGDGWCFKRMSAYASIDKLRDAKEPVASLHAGGDTRAVMMICTVQGHTSQQYKHGCSKRSESNAHVYPCMAPLHASGSCMDS